MTQLVGVAKKQVRTIDNTREQADRVILTVVVVFSVQFLQIIK